MPDQPVSKTSGGETGAEIPAPPGEGLPGAARPHSEYVAGAVLPAYLHGHRVSHSWHESMERLMIWDELNERRLQAPYRVHVSGPNGMVEGRNMAVKQFLDESVAEWLWFIDTDMGFAPDVVDRLVEAASVEQHRLVVGALCFAMKNVGSDGYGGYNVRPLPTIFTLARDRDGTIGFLGLHCYPPNTVLRVAGTGTGCLLIHRHVLEEIRAKFGDHWFDLVQYENGTTISEDLSFCWRLGHANRNVFVHTGVQTTHHKDIWVGEGMYEMPDEEPYRRVNGSQS